MEYASHYEKNTLTKYTVLKAETGFQRIEFWHDRYGVEFYIVANDDKRWFVDSWSVEVGSTAEAEIARYFEYVLRLEGENVEWWRNDEVLEPAAPRC